MRPVFALLPSSYLVYICIAVLAGWWLVMRFRKSAGVWRLRYFAFPRPWLKHLHEHVPLYGRLPWELRAPYQDKVLHFVDSKGFRACGALDEVTEAMRVIIAGNACLLLLNGSGENTFPGILTVQVFPSDDPDAEARSSCVAIHWDAEKWQATDPRDEGNAALPVIAARLGWEIAGRPALPEALLLTAWARTRSAEFIKAHPGVLESAVGSAPRAEGSPGKPDDSPKSEDFSPADIFAVATEMFLAAPALLQQRKPELYTSLRLFYLVDPARWTLKK